MSDDLISRQMVLEYLENSTNAVYYIRKLPSIQPKSNIKALGDEMRICQKSITDEKVLIGFNMAVAICNKHLAESEDRE